MKFIIYKDANGKWRWKLISEGKIIAESGDGYFNKQTCLYTIYMVKSSGGVPIEDEKEAILDDTRQRSGAD